MDQLIPTIVKAVRLSLNKDYNRSTQSLDDNATPANTNVLKPEHLSGHIPLEIQSFFGPLPTLSES